MYDKITEPVKDQAKAEFREDYDPILPVSKFFKRIENATQLADDEKFPWQTEKSFIRSMAKFKNMASTRMNARSG